jgi:tetratricopeptide (TPR) repeat protein
MMLSQNTHTNFAAYRDPRYVQGKALLKAKQYDTAIDAFCELLEALDQQFGPNHLESAPILFEYGSALVLKAESAANLFGDAAPADQQNNADGASARPQREQQQQQQGGNDEDLEIAWEVLEVARVILSTHTMKHCRLLLARVYLRLADLSLDQGNPEQSIMDYKHCLQERVRFLDKSDRLLADVHAALAVAYLYSSARHQDQAAQRSSSIHHYLEAVKVFELLLENIYIKTSSPIIAAYLPKLVEKYNHSSYTNKKDNNSNDNKKNSMMMMSNSSSNSGSPNRFTNYSKAIEVKSVNWTAGMANGWHPASATDNVKRTRRGKKLRVKRTHPAAALTKDEEQIDELTMALKDLREKVADTIKLKNDGIAAEEKKKRDQLAAINAAAYGTSIEVETAKILKQQNETADATMSSSSSSSNTTTTSNNGNMMMMMSPTPSSSSSCSNQNQNLFGNSGFDKPSVSEGVTTIGFGSSSTTMLSNAPTPDSFKVNGNNDTTKETKNGNGVKVEYGFGKPTLPTSAATNILQGRKKTKKRKVDLSTTTTMNANVIAVKKVKT